MNAPSTVSVTTLRLFVEAVERIGIDSRDLLSACDIETSSLEDSELRLPQSVYEATFLKAQHLSSDAAIGLHAGEHVHARAVNLLGYLMLSSATILDGLNRVARYQLLLTNSSWLEIEESSNEVRVRVNSKSLDPAVREIHAEYMLAMILAMMRWVSGAEIRPLETHYAHAPHTGVAEYERVMKARVRFHCDANQMIFAREMLTLPSQHHDRAMEHLHENLAKWLLEQRSDRSVCAEVRRTLFRHLEDGVVEIENVARHLGMSVRSLQRRLGEEDTSFRKVLDRLRRELAREHLEHLGTPVAEVAYLTGFSEVSAFTRATRRWFGCTPSRMRGDAPTTMSKDVEQTQAND
jgi:AraC-like DNA-binding protein